MEAAGHEVGNHSYSHPKLVFMWPSQVREEIQRTDSALRRIGVTGPMHFRAPHAALKAQGYQFETISVFVGRRHPGE